jgi:phage terminase large subunit-like protein
MIFGHRGLTEKAAGVDWRGVPALATTPKPIKLVRELLADTGTVTTRGSTYDNRAHLAEGFFARIIKRYEGTRLGRQELNAELLEDVEGALWTGKMIEDTRVEIRVLQPPRP